MTENAAVGLFGRKPANDLVPIHRDNVGNNDWAILLEAGTIVGPAPQRIRVARWMQEKKIVKKYDMFLRAKYFMVVEGYNPRIHVVYFCPQLFRHESGRLVPLEGEEMGELIARAVEDKVVERRAWYAPLEKLPRAPLINGSLAGEFDTLVVEVPAKREREALPAGGPQLLSKPAEHAEASGM